MNPGVSRAGGWKSIGNQWGPQVLKVQATFENQVTCPARGRDLPLAARNPGVREKNLAWGKNKGMSENRAEGGGETCCCQ